jgi:hypothetical protein
MMEPHSEQMGASVVTGANGSFWEVRKHGVNLQRIVMNWLYPAALHKGRPNLVESAMRTSPHDEDVRHGKLPTAVFVDGPGAQIPPAH